MDATSVRVAAVDLGATSGRVMVAEVGVGRLTLEEVHRFANGPVTLGDSLRWDVERLHQEVLSGLRAAARAGRLDGIGIDSWAVDFGLLDDAGRLLGLPYCYRDARNEQAAARVLAEVPAAELYAVNGLQHLPFTTVNQLVAARGAGELAGAGTMLLLPDLLACWLTGERGAERTNASTTGLYDVRSRTWATGLAERLDLPAGILPPLRTAGDVIGPVRPEVDADLAGVPVIAVGSHDTASAVVAVPAAVRPTAYISSGTWSLVGLELDEPVLTDEARDADFTNEAGVDGTIRFLKNVMGLWVLSESIRTWGADLPELLAAAERAEPLRTVIDIDDPSLLPPGDMPARVVALAAAAGEPEPRGRAELVRCILDSLAVAYRRQLRTAARLAGVEVEVLHVVGGGSQNALLCQLTADACGVPVEAGPVEASALGNVLVQARALGVDLPDLPAMRALLRATQQLTRYLPRTGADHGDRAGSDWAAAEDRVGKGMARARVARERMGP